MDDVEDLTLDWVDWYNNRRLHSLLDYVLPEGYETAYYAGSRAIGAPLRFPVVMSSLLWRRPKLATDRTAREVFHRIYFVKKQEQQEIVNLLSGFTGSFQDRR